MRDELRRWVLEILSDAEVTGPEVRGRLAAGGLCLNPLAFPDLTAQMEVDGLVRGRYEPVGPDGTAVGWRRCHAAAIVPTQLHAKAA